MAPKLRTPFLIVNPKAYLGGAETLRLALLTDELALYDGVGTFQDPEAVVAAQPRTIGVNARIAF